MEHEPRLMESGRAAEVDRVRHGIVVGAQEETVDSGTRRTVF